MRAGFEAEFIAAPYLSALMRNDFVTYFTAHILSGAEYTTLRYPIRQSIFRVITAVNGEVAARPDHFAVILPRTTVLRHYSDPVPVAWRTMKRRLNRELQRPDPQEFVDSLWPYRI